MSRCTIPRYLFSDQAKDGVEFHLRSWLHQIVEQSGYPEKIGETWKSNIWNILYSCQG